AAERQPRDARRRDRAAGDGEAVPLGRGVELAPAQAGLRVREPSFGIDVDPLHLREVDDEAALADRAAGDVVAAATDRDLEPFGAPVLDRTGDVLRVPAADDHRRALVDQAVVELACALVLGVIRTDHLAGERVERAHLASGMIGRSRYDGSSPPV